MEFVTGFIDSPAFKPWDIGDHVSPRLAHAVGSIDNFTLTNELLHQAAFRDGLGNSLHSPDYMVSVLSQLVLKNLCLYTDFILTQKHVKKIIKILNLLRQYV